MKRLVLGILLLAGAATAAKELEVYFIDVEGGQAILLVPGGGDSVLIDTGWSGKNRRDAERIAAAAKAAGVKRIDYLVVTHYHVDHIGGIEPLVQKLPVRNFVDHGPSAESGREADILFRTYAAQRDKGAHIVAKPGDRLPIKGMEVQVVAAAGKTIASALAGAGQPNAECAAAPQRKADDTENGQSLGMLISFGPFRMAALGDLTMDREDELVCPANKLGRVDLYVMSNHGDQGSGSKELVRALEPRVAVMNNSARKGGAPEVWQTVHDSPGLLDVWQLHFSVAGGRDQNSSDTLIANVDEICEGKWLKLTVHDDGTFTIYNSRNKYEKTYQRN